ncbi:HigB toxin protein (fragment) [Candidatus Desulfarcum epimagneticum]|uniref:HigB toxin protein n=1 Tax=uncultured Desulfobacteraceae bacterium TaxID=218296 RepID=A0A484HMA3_9BACT
MKKSKTNWEKIDSMSDEELTQNAISDPDNPPLDDTFFSHSKPVDLPRGKKQITLRIDEDVYIWFKANSKKYQTHINAVLKAYKESRVNVINLSD